MIIRTGLWAEILRIWSRDRKWKNGSERIPESFGNPVRAGIIGTYTAKGNSLYIHIFRWPGETAVIPGIKTKVIHATILETGQEVAVKQTENGKVFLRGLPKRPPHRDDTVIKLKLNGRPEGYDYTNVPL